MDNAIAALLLGILEGLTEFIPVSSTGHLILAQSVFGYDPVQWRQFNIVIQLGAVLAVIAVYWRLFFTMGMGLLRREARAIAFVRNIVLGFVPAAVIGVLAKDGIDILLGSPLVVASALVIGGIAILALERWIPARKETSVADLGWRTAMGIGLAQCLAMIPGTSRSGASILGALALGVDRKTAAEFSFFLAVPTMLGAALVKILDEPALLAGEAAIGWNEIGIGFASAFVTALVVVRAFVFYVSRHGFAPFAWYRIALGIFAWVWFAFV